MIVKETTINITQEDIDSTEDIEVRIHVNGPTGPDDGATYVITYPKETKREDT